MSDSRNRRPLYVVAAVSCLGLVALYIALGGPLPVPTNPSPAIETVPSEADAVVYADAWTFSSESSRNVIDGLLGATNRSLPGYTGPASLDAAFEALQSTDLDPAGLRSVTAFLAYTNSGGASDYQALVLRTTWSREAILNGFGGNASSYEARTYADRTVYVTENESAQFQWVGDLGQNRVILGNGSAVRDAVDTVAGTDDGIDPTLRRGFDSLKRGPVRFAAVMPDTVPGSRLAPQRVTDTIAAIDTLAGVYLPEEDGASVELEVRTTDTDSAADIEPVVADAVAFARSEAPPETAALLSKASVSRQGRLVRVALSGTTQAFVDGYRAFLESAPVRLLLGQSVGTPALDLVPSDVDVVGYADAGLIADPTTVGVLSTVAAERSGPGTDAVLDELVGAAANATLDPIALRSVTAFATENGTTPTGAVIEAEWSAETLQETLTGVGLNTEPRSVDGVSVFELRAENRTVWLAVLGDGRHAVGSPESVQSVIHVSQDRREAVGEPLRTAFERLPDGYLTVVSRPPSNLALESLPGGSELQALRVAGLSYDSQPPAATLQVDLTFTDADTAERARGLVDSVRRILVIQVEDDRVRRFLDRATLGRADATVTATVRTDARTLLALTEWVLETVEEGGSGLPVDSRSSVGVRPG